MMSHHTHETICALQNATQQSTILKYTGTKNNTDEIPAGLGRVMGFDKGPGRSRPAYAAFRLRQLQ
jgi:hypothetical protein